ncbi:acetoacetyl-CoA synthetase [Caerostris extrusa]|uniref:Acetoacetyl-CoA synthetase n=1 Tax=Caerostris extrusa TaxID=172846 RepID=A0AAV4N241_CAEEX|nr:acetoacetyl-CoA synthetase [Caerostris extrusa]
MVVCTPCLEKVIIVPTREETLSRDLSDIRNSILLEDFLQSGRTPDGLVPDINSNSFLSTTPSASTSSGTTGLPKGPVHSAGVGWSLWDYPLSSLALGVKIFLYNGSPYFNRKGSNIWDIFSQYKVSFAFLATSMIDKSHRSFGAFSGFDFNTPSYGGEIQAPALGVDIRCYDFNGIWSQNDECWINPKTNGIIVIGRSDDTLKQNGERFGSGDIYFAIHQMEELQDYLCVGQDGCDGDTRAVLFVKTEKKDTLSHHS